MLRPNPDHSIKHGRSRAVSAEVVVQPAVVCPGRGGGSPKMGDTVAMVLHLPRGFFLRLQINAGYSFPLPWGGGRQRW
jgi:hypothetical protein